MVNKTLFKVSSNPLNDLHASSVHDEVLKEEIYSLQNNKVTVRTISESGLNFNELPFERRGC